MRIKFTFLALCCFLQISLFAQEEVANTFAQANELYKQKKYEEAVKLYEDLVVADWESTELYYNLGNAYYKKKELGKAILNYERALLLDAGNEDVLYNLALAEGEREDEIEVLPPFFLAAWWQNMRHAATSTTWGIIGLLLLWAGIAGLVILLLGKNRKQKKLGFIAGMVLLLLSMLPLSLSYSRAQIEENSGTGIVLAKKINLKSGPDDASTTLNKLHEGTKVKLLDQVGEWHQIRLQNGEIGWLAVSGFEEI